MPRPALLPLLRHRGAVALRLVLWPLAILGLSDLASRSENDALAGGLTAFAVIAGLAFVLPLLDGLVLRNRALLLVWSITTGAIVASLVAQPLTYAFVGGPEGTTWDYAVHAMFADLPSSLLLFLVLVGVPVALGAVAGAALRRSVEPVEGPTIRTPEVGAPRA